MSSVFNFNPSEYRILVVDDVVANILLLKVLLTNEKFGILTASGGCEAIDITQKEKPDLILLDVMMPDKSGFEVAKTLKEDENTAEIPIIFLTALDNPSDIVEGFHVGGNDFVSKPFSKDELIVRVKHQISLIAAKRTIIEQRDELEKTIEGRDKMYSVIAHDLRSPMGSVKMVLNLLSLSLTPDTIGADMAELLNTANHTVEDLFALLDNLLKWTKSMTGKLKVVYQDFDIIEVVKGAIEIFAMVAQAKNIEIVMEHSDPINVHADIDMMKTICRNLLSNAIKFSKQDKKIEIKVGIEGDMAVVSVRDYGEGIPKEAQAKLMHVNTHFSTFGTNKEEGSGLGLLLCQDFATKNGGKIWFESTEGEGSTFSFSIPLQVV
jgi:two-component system sensor histidine kinase/response regulator